MTPSQNLDEWQGQPIGYGSAVVNSQLIGIAPKSAYDPLVFAGAYSGPGWPRQGVYDVPPVVPSAESSSAYAWSNPAGMGAPGGTYPTATDETGSPFSVSKSPLWWALGFIAASLLFLHYVVYK
jgi:hypothetical protein